MTPGITKHTDREYERQLGELRQRILLMAGRVEEMIDNSIRALVDLDAPRAQQTIEADGRVNLDEIEIDQLCLLILAKRQPLASDLRFIALAFRMVIDLERIGDLAVNICERAIDLSAAPLRTALGEIPRMADLVRSLIHDAIDAFVEGDADKAQDVIDRDDEVDELYTHIFRDILDEMLQDPAAVQEGIHIQSVAKWLERMADHATNLAEQVVFMVKGQDVRHEGKLDAR